MASTEMGAMAERNIVLGTTMTYETRMPFVALALANRCHAACEPTAHAIREEAAENLGDAGEHPYATGYLAGSLEVIELDREGDWAVATDVEYAPYVEYGTAHAPPHPFLGPAVEAHRGEFVNAQTIAVAEASKA